MTVRYTNGNENINKKLTPLEMISFKVIKWVGTPYSVLLHTLLFVTVPALTLLGYELRTVLLIFTTWLSIEAIYLAIFIQMSVNRNTQSLQEVEEDIEDIQEDVTEEEAAHKVILHIGNELKVIQHDLNLLKKKGII